MNDTADVGLHSYWMVDALATEPSPERRPPLRGALTADVCIVGGGYTGLWTAIELKRRDPGLSVVVVEARRCGAGASGANAGIAMNLWPKLTALVAAGGPDGAIMIARESVRAVDHLIDFCTEHRIDAQVHRTGWLWAATNPSQDDAWSEVVASAGPHDAPFKVVGAEEASRLAGTRVRGGVFDPTCAHLHPGRLARGLAKAAESVGVSIHEHSAMTALGRMGGDPVVETRTGSVRATSVVLAINAWASTFRQFRRHLVMTASDNLVVDPGVEHRTPTGGASVSDSGRLLDYWRPLEDGKLLFGKAGLGLGYGARGANTLFRPAPRPERLRAQLAKTHPHLAAAHVTSTWRAPVEYSVSSLPFFVPLTGQPRVFCGTGYSGDGIGPSVLGGRILASLATDVEDELSTSFLTRMPSSRGLPPEPLRFLGGQVVKAALLRRDRLEDAARPIDPLTRLVTRIDPTTFVG